MGTFRLDRVRVQRGTAVLLDDVSAEFRAGLCTALVGPSGAGKSTLLRLLNRLEEPTGGTVTLDGEPLPSFEVRALRRRVGLVMQRPVLLAPTVAADVRTGAPDLPDDVVAALLDRVGLPVAFLDRATTGLSGGEAQRVCLARALAIGPDTLLADEPTSALDAASVEVVEQVLRAFVDGGGTVVLVSHNAGQADRLADATVALAEGRVRA